MRRLCGIVVVATVAAGWVAAAEEQRPPVGRGEQALLDYFHRLTLSAADMDRLAATIARLESPAYKEREKANAALVQEGPRALPMLRQALAGATLEKRMRLEKCIKALDDPRLVEAAIDAVQRLQATAPPGAEAVLFAYAPFAPDEVIDEVLEALCRLAGRTGKADPRYLAALDDPVPARRAAAAVVVGAFGTAAERDRVRKLLTDDDAGVRLRAAHGLLLARDTSGIAVLIALVAEPDNAVAERAEILLATLADGDGPKDVLTDRAKRVAAWRAWWAERERSLDLTRSAVPLGHADGPRQAGRVAEEFFKGLMTNDLPLLSRSTDFPFNLSHQQLFATREAFEGFYAGVLQNNFQNSKGVYKARVVRVLDAAEQQRLCTTDRDKEYVKQIGRGRAWFVQLILNYGQAAGQVERYTVVVRVSGGRVRVAGFLEYTSPDS
jgi:hypothetical protein